MKKIFQTIVALLIVSSIVGASASIIRTYQNETNILNIYTCLKEIKEAIQNLDKKVDDLKEF